jgi:S-DNA-T family DNA segregation ATPase FtsK/SpoIIIE
MAKKIVNPTSTLQINFDKESKKDRVPGEVTYRIRLILGWFLFFIGTLLTLSFVSSFVVGVADQSEVELGAADVIAGSDIPVKNWAGLLGAKIAHFFIFRTFGWSSFLLIPLFFLSGLKLAYKREIYSVDRLSWQVLF